MRGVQHFSSILFCIYEQFGSGLDNFILVIKLVATKSDYASFEVIILAQIRSTAGHRPHLDVRGLGPLLGLRTSHTSLCSVGMCRFSP